MLSPKSNPIAVLNAVCLILVIAGCDGSTQPRLPGPAATLTIVSGDLQSATVGSALPDPLLVEVRDSEGRPVPGQLLNFRVTEGGGSVVAGAAETNHEGRAQELWVLGPVARDTQRIEVRAIDPVTGTSLASGTFRAVGVPGPPANIERVSADGREAVVGSALLPAPTIRIRDQYGNPVSGVTVSFVPTAGGGSVTGETQVTDTTGLLTVGSWTLGTAAGLNTLTATTTGTSPLTVQFTATGVPAFASQIVIDQAANGAKAGVAFTQQPRIRLLDAFGNLALNAAETVTISVSSGGVLVGNTSKSPTDGVVLFTDAGLGGLAGTYDLSYSAVLNGMLKTVTHQIVLSPGLAAQLLLDRPAAGAAGGLPFSTQPILRTADAYGNPVTDVAGQVFAQDFSGRATIIGSSSAPLVNGVAHFNNLGVSGAAATYTLSFRPQIAGDVPHISQSIVVSPGSPHGYRVTASRDTIEVGTSVELSAQVVDSDGNPSPFPGLVVQWTSHQARGKLSATQSITNAAGIATNTFTADTIQIAGQRITTIVVEDNTGRSGELTFAVLAGAAARLTFTHPVADAGYGVGFRPGVVGVVDRYGNLRTQDHNRPISFALGSNPTGTTLQGAVTSNTYQGTTAQAANDVIIYDPAVGYSLIASSPGLQSATSNTFSVGPVGTLLTTTERISAFNVVAGAVHHAAQTAPGSTIDFKQQPRTGGLPVSITQQGTCNDCARIFGDETRFLFATGTDGTTPTFALEGGGLQYSGAGRVNDIAFDGQYVYFSGGTDSDQRTVRIELATNQATTLLAGFAPEEMAVADGVLYFVQDSLVKSIPVAGGVSTTVANLGTGGTPAEMLVNNGTIYLLMSGEIRSMPVSGGVVTTRVSGISNPVDMKADANALYLSAGGALLRYSLPDFTAATLLSTTENVRHIALEGESVYWTSSTMETANCCTAFRKMRK